MASFDIGDRITLRASFVNLTGIPASPTTVICKVKDPTGAVTIYSGISILNPSVGLFTHDYSIVQEGTYYYRFEGTGIIEAAAESVFLVKDSQFF